MCDDTESDIEYAIKQIATAITANGAPGPDAAGGLVGSLTEAVMGMTSALCKIAYSIDRVSEIYESNSDIGSAIERLADQFERYNDATLSE